MEDSPTRQVARPANRGLTFIFSLGVLLFAPLASIRISQTNGLERVSWAVLLCFGVICLIPAVYFWAVRLEWTDETLVLRAGPWRRSVSLTSLTCLGYKRSGRTGVYLLEDGFGRSLRVDVSGFGRDDVWKRHLLQSAHRSGAQISPKAEESLRHASGTGRGYLA